MTIFHWVRHEESMGNLAAKAAQKLGAQRLAIPWPTQDIPLSPEGRVRAAAIKPPKSQIVFTSPQARALETMHLCMPGLGFYVKDLRLVDKESGVFDKLSVRGMQDLYPEEWEERQRVGKFYHRPPGGESWLDVAIRVKAFMDSKLKFDSVLVFSHDVTILTAIFLSSEMTPEELLEFQRNTPVENGSVTSLTYKGVSNVENRGVGLVSR